MNGSTNVDAIDLVLNKAAVPDKENGECCGFIRVAESEGSDKPDSYSIWNCEYVTVAHVATSAPAVLMTVQLIFVEPTIGTTAAIALPILPLPPPVAEMVPVSVIGPAVPPGVATAAYCGLLLDT